MYRKIVYTLYASSVVVSMCQRDDSRGRGEVAFYVHVTWRDPARTSPRSEGWGGGGEGGNKPGTHEGIGNPLRVLSARSWTRERRRNIKELLSGERADAAGVRKAEWERARGWRRRRRRLSLTEGLERDWKSQSAAESWMEERPPSRPLSLLYSLFLPAGVTLPTGRRIIKEIHSLTLPFCSPLFKQLLPIETDSADQRVFHERFSVDWKVSILLNNAAKIFIHFF